MAGSYKTNDSGYRDFVETDLDYNGSWIELKGYRSRTVRTSFYCMKRGMIGGANGSTWVEGIVERQWRDNIGWLKYTKCKGGWDNNLYYKRIGKDVTEICQEKNVN